MRTFFIQLLKCRYEKISIVVLCLLTSCALLAQNSFKITGKMELLSQSKTIILSGSYGEFIGNINPDGSFVIEGDNIQPGTALIKTDSSSANALWLEPGDYTVKFIEIKLDTSRRFYFRIPELKGPTDAEIYHDFSEPMFYIKGGSREEIMGKFKQFYSNYIDSIFKINPSTATMPEMLRVSRGFLGDEKVKEYMDLLDENQKRDPSANSINNYFKRKEKIENEIFFRDFQMKDQNEKVFKLSSLNKKLILLDFWSSDCAPCRKKHPRLAELYKKYADKGFEIISVSLDDTEKEWEKAIIKDNMVWINVSELKGWKTALAEDYYVNSLPFSIWLDENKKIISISDLSDKEIEEYLK